MAGESLAAWGLPVHSFSLSERNLTALALHLFLIGTFVQVPLCNVWFLYTFVQAPWMVFKMASASKGETYRVEKKSRLKLEHQKIPKKKEDGESLKKNFNIFKLTQT